MRARLVALRESLGTAPGNEAALGWWLCDTALNGPPGAPAPEVRAQLGAGTAAEATWSDLLSAADTDIADRVTRDALNAALGRDAWRRIGLALESRLVNAVRSEDSHAVIALLRAALVAGFGDRATIRQGVGQATVLPLPDPVTGPGVAQAVQHAWVLAEMWRPGATRALAEGRAAR